MHNKASVLENDTHNLLWDFDIHTDHLISARRPDLVVINRKNKRTCKIVDFAVPADHRIKLKESEKNWEFFKKLKNMKVKIIPIAIVAFGTVTKVLLKDRKTWKLEEETIQTTALLRTARILRRFL